MTELFAGEGMSRMVLDDKMWSGSEKLPPKPKGRHCKSVCYVNVSNAASCYSVRESL